MSTSFDAHFLGPDVHGSRPSAGSVPQGTKYSCSTHGLIEESDGVSTWSTWYGDVLGGSVTFSYGSNATHVAEISSAGASNAVARADHYHAGIAQVTSSSSNTLQRGTFNLRAGANVGLTASDSDGDGEFDTVTVHSSGAGGGGSSTNLASARKVHVEGSNYTSSSGTFADVDATDLSLTISTGARRVLVTVTCQVATDTALDGVYLDVDLDGTRLGNTTLGLVAFQSPTANLNHGMTISHVTAVLTAASHTFKLQWRRNSAGTMTMFSTSATWPVHFAVTELYAA